LIAKQKSMMNDGSDTSRFLLADYYDYELPKDLIAQHPLANREDARLMTIDRDSGTINHRYIRDLDQLLKAGDCLVLNNTKVVPAKLVGYRTRTRGRWQGLFLEADQSGNWRMLCKTRGKAQPGEKVTLQDRHGTERLTLELIARLEDGSWVVRPNAKGTTEEILEIVGRVPLPNYIRGGNMVDSDFANYQTVFAKESGAVAAPTAGLHLTKMLLGRIIDAGVHIAQVTLHVGIGTFRPVTVDDLSTHKMHFERGSIDEKAVNLIKQTRAHGGRVIAVGTTSVRVLETVGAEGELRPWSGETELFIRPPYQFKTVDGLLTNFHLPRSTLLVLIRTFGGDELMQRAYAEAIEEKYRFFSYGDAMLIT
jgi:S-adenosylmethionine:tRNA ribosyltransferase-isomerase